MKNAFLIGATSSGSGKTTLSLGLMKALQKKGSIVQPYKCGPDYIDPQFHKMATGKDSINLDLFMASPSHIKSLFNQYSSNSQINIIEGVMGLFDGFDGFHGSSANVAELLDIPVVLLVNAASTAYSVAPLIYGFSRFYDKIRIAGVIFNRVSSEKHYQELKKGALDCGIVSLGFLTKNNDLVTPSRHLGLSLDSVSEIEKFIDAAAMEVERNVDIYKLLEVTHFPEKDVLPEKEYSSNLRVGVAWDEAFNFIYPENLKALGKNIVYFSPLKDHNLPDVDLIYLPGGYPELYAEELEKNFSMRNAVNNYIENGGKLLAECGGFIYLTQGIDGRKMCGVFPLKTTMKKARLRLGYRKIHLPQLVLKGHEFHYSKIAYPENLDSIACMYNAKNETVDTPMLRYKNAIAGYTHLYWAETDILKLWEE